MLLLGLPGFLTAGRHRRATKPERPGGPTMTLVSSVIRTEGRPAAPAAPAVRKRRIPRWLAVTVLIALLLAVGGSATLVIAGHMMTSGYTSRSLTALPPEKAKSDPGALAAKIRGFEKKLAALAPTGIHVVVDTAANKLYLKDGTKVLREAVISCGSGLVLVNPFGGKDWVFDTPRGERTVKGKITNPVWTKPDWAFIEEGEAIPKSRKERIEEGVLGDYALAIGNGYLLHGTLYKRMLGRNVSHGCIRIGDEDLEVLYRTVPVGAKVFLY